MRTTLNLSESLVKEAMRLTSIKEKTALIHAGLEALIAIEARKRLIALGGHDPKAKGTSRRKA